ncbi:MAG: IS1634 family transposase [Bacillota bacterium]
MFFRKVIARSNGKEYAYLKLIENYREGGKVKQRVIANLGNLENLTPEKVEGLISGLRKICGLSSSSSRQVNLAAEETSIQAAGVSEKCSHNSNSIQLKANDVLRYGEVLAIHKVWEILDLQGAIKETFSDSNNGLDKALLVELMVINQIIKPQNKEVISDWHQFLRLPETEGIEIFPHHFYRTMDIIAGDRESLEKRVFERIKCTVPVDTDIAFCLLTTGEVETSPSKFNASLYGKYFFEEPEEDNKVDLGILVSRNGMPFGHRILQDSADEAEYGDIVNYLQSNYSTERCIFVGDRSFNINQNLENLIARGYEYLVRRKLWKKEDLDLARSDATPGRDGYLQANDDLWFKEVRKGDIRYLFCFNPKEAEAKKIFLAERLNSIESELRAIQIAVDESRHESFLRQFNKNAPVFKDEYSLRYFNWNYDKASRKFTYSCKDDLLELDLNVAGLFILETNSAALSGRELLESYINLVQIRDSFREITEFAASPYSLKVNQNISANVMVCVLAAMIEKTLERIIRGAGINLNSRQTLQLLEEIKFTVNQLGEKEVKSAARSKKTQGKYSALLESLTYKHSSI